MYRQLVMAMTGSTILPTCVCVPDFSNVISKSEVKALAEADEQEVVAEVQVSLRCDLFFCDVTVNDV